MTINKFSILLLAAPLLFPSAVSAATLSLSPSSGTFNKGCSFSLDVVLDTQGAQTDGTDVILIYDPSRFSITTSSIIAKTDVYPDFPGNNVDEAAGKITILGLASVQTPFSGKGTLATLQFMVKESAPAGATQIKFDFDPNDKAKTSDSNVVERTTIADVLNSVVNGSYTVGTGTCGQVAPTPTPKPGGGPIATSSGFPSPTYVPVKPLPPAGTQELTFTLAIVGSVLTILGILGLALL